MDDLNTPEVVTKRRPIYRSLKWVKIAQAMFIILAVLWIVFSVLSLIRFSSLTASIVACMMAGNAGMLALVGLGLGNRQKRIYYIALVILLVNIALTFADELGLMDLIVLALYLILGLLLLATRSLYQKPG